MSDPVITTCYEVQPGGGFETLERDLEGIGLTLSRPGDDAVIRHSEFGDEVPSSREEVLRMAEGETSVAMDVWLDEAVSAFVSISRVSANGYYERLSIDTLGFDRQIAVSKSMIERFRRLTGKRFIVVDLVGESFEWTDWLLLRSDAAGLPQEIPTAVSPTVLGMSDQLAFGSIAYRFKDYAIKSSNGIVLASRPPNLEDFPAWRREHYRRAGTWVRMPPARLR